ncbi:CLUMA_CG010202, isoform A [Clunio marinus]|uniref:CLUMA_CG010202, isoform A n=1 Tax=Clunio marinus TaxID=568069 RepID=A0A1J1IC68_9DIPT|nr:CLUMA_CG010202, isoform A [Clunio marinus]
MFTALSTDMFFMSSWKHLLNFYSTFYEFPVGECEENFHVMRISNIANERFFTTLTSRHIKVEKRNSLALPNKEIWKKKKHFYSHALSQPGWKFQIWLRHFPTKTKSIINLKAFKTKSLNLTQCITSQCLQL